MIAGGLILALIISGCSSNQKDNNKETSAKSIVTDENENNGGEDIQADVSIGVEGELQIENSEEYLNISENTIIAVSDNPLLTCSLKVDTASYNNVERYIESGNLPPTDAVRTEELINYFNYETKLSFTEEPFSIYTEIGTSPFDENKYLAFVRVKAKDIDKEELPNSNLTFLIDTSGSMNSYDKLPLLKSAFSLLVDTLTEDDIVSIVTYAGSSSIILDSVSGADKDTILNAIYDLDAGGSTAGADGILTAYKLAEKNEITNGNNRIILATDGDFNVGLSTTEELEDLVAEKRDNGIYLSILGFGTGNIKDNIMETLSANGNGNYSYINSVASAKKVLVDELGSNLFTIADDVKTQIEFNPENVSSYRLIGYENRLLQDKDFENDAKDAGEIGIGTDVVMLFEIELTQDLNSTNLKYSEIVEEHLNDSDFGEELFEVRIRYKNPGETESNLVTHPVTFESITDDTSTDFGFAVSVAEFGHLLRNSEYLGDVTITDVISKAESNLGLDHSGYRSSFVNILEQYKNLINNEH